MPNITESNARARVTPAVRALANRAGVDLAAVTGTGVGGRITTGDVRAAAATTRPDDGWFPGLDVT